MSDRSHSKVKLNVRVTPKKKREWKDALEEGETLSSLVRRAVDKELSDEYVNRHTISEIADSGAQQNLDLTPLTERLSDLQSSVTAVEHKVDTLSLSTADEGEEDEDIEEIAMDLLPRLPSYPEDIPEHVLKSIDGKSGMDDQEYISFIIKSCREDDQLSIDGSAQKFSTQMGISPHLIREALIHLETNTTENVKSTIDDGTRHWMHL
jgi:hypothetical protein